jgi:NtrC-family two-component system response regulator AlgB
VTTSCAPWIFPIACSPRWCARDAGGASLEELERRHIQQVLAESATLEEAAARLGINVTTLWRKRKRYGIE